MSKKTNYKVKCEKAKRHDIPMGVLGLALHPDGNQSFAACMDGVYAVNVDDGQCRKLYSHESYVSGVVCLHERNLLVSAGYDGALQWFDLDSGRVVRHIQAHRFWSWDLARAEHAPVIASSSGQYLAGGYRYEPRATSEPCVRVYDGISGRLISSFEHGPPVQSVAISADGNHVAAGNLMGDVGVWQVEGAQKASWNTPDFTGFGIIKSHCFIGGLYAAAFVPNSEDLVVAGMGPMRDPMAGNGKQRWQRFRWTGGEPIKVAASDDKQVGEGLMETLAFHPSGDFFVMAGRLRGGAWNVGLFDVQSGDLLTSLKTGPRVTKAVFSEDGSKLFLAGANRQRKEADKSFGVVDIYDVSRENAS